MASSLIGNPQDVLTTPYGYSGQFSPETAVQEQALNRRRLITNMLMQQGLQQPQGQMVGRFYVPANPMQHVSGLLQAGLGAYLGTKIDDQQKELATNENAGTNKVINAYLEAMKPRQDQPPAPPMPPPQGQTMPPQEPPSAPTEPFRGIAPRPEGPYSGEVGAVPMPGVGVQSGAPPIETQRPESIAGQTNLQGLDMGNAQPADMSQFAPPATDAQPLPPQPAPAPTLPPPQPRMVERTREEKLENIARLMASQYPAAQRFAMMEYQRMNQEGEHARDQSNKDRAFSLDERGLGLKDKGLTLGAERNRLLDATQQQQFAMNYEAKQRELDQQHQYNTQRMQDARMDHETRNKIAEQNLAIEKQKLALDADLKRLTLQQGKTPQGYRATKEGNLEPIPGGPADTKLQGAFNQDTAMLQNSNAGFDRLAASVNELMNHPGLAGITGVRGKVPDIPGSDAANARALLNTIKSQVGFGVLQEMRNNSKSGGALGSVSDAEGKRLENNLAALDTTQGADQFKSQLKNILDYADSAKGRLRDTFNMKHKTGEPVPMGPSGKGPSVGTVDGGYRFKGGDPSKPESWEKVN
jgi:hypothetical protein